MKNSTSIKIDTGDMTLSRGITKTQDGTYLAMTFSQSKEFKTLKGAQNWMEKRTR